MWPRDSETPVTECVVCAWNNTRSLTNASDVEALPRPDVCCQIVVVVTFFNNNFVNCKAISNYGYKNTRSKIQYKPKRCTYTAIKKLIKKVVRWCMATQRREDKTCEFKVNSSLDWKPVPLAQHWRDVFPTSGSSEESSGGILDRLNSPNIGCVFKHPSKTMKRMYCTASWPVSILVKKKFWRYEKS